MDCDLISIIIPIYNVEQFLTECINSVLEQTYENIEIILVDDGSTDQSGEICDQYKRLDSRINVIHKENGGLSDARNTGINKARGKYYAFIDSDDYVDSEMIKTMYDGLKRNCCEIAVCNMIRFGNDESKTAFYQPVKEETVFKGIERFQTLNQPSVCNKLFCADLFREIKFPKEKYYEDTYIYHEILYKAQNIVLTGKDSYWYRVRQDSIVGRAKYTIQYFDYIEAVYCRAKFLEQKRIQPYWQEACLSLYAALASAEKNIEKTDETKKYFQEARKEYKWSYKKLKKQKKYFGVKQRIRLILLRYFPKIHVKLY